MAKLFIVPDADVKILFSAKKWEWLDPIIFEHLNTQENEKRTWPRKRSLGANDIKLFTLEWTACVFTKWSEICYYIFKELFYQILSENIQDRMFCRYQLSITLQK